MFIPASFRAPHNIDEVEPMIKYIAEHEDSYYRISNNAGEDAKKPVVPASFRAPHNNISSVLNCCNGSPPSRTTYFILYVLHTLIAMSAISFQLYSVPWCVRDSMNNMHGSRVQ